MTVTTHRIAFPLLPGEEGSLVSDPNIDLGDCLKGETMQKHAKRIAKATGAHVTFNPRHRFGPIYIVRAKYGGPSTGRRTVRGAYECARWITRFYVHCKSLDALRITKATGVTVKFESDQFWPHPHYVVYAITDRAKYHCQTVQIAYKKAHEAARSHLRILSRFGIGMIGCLTPDNWPPESPDDVFAAAFAARDYYDKGDGNWVSTHI